MCLTYDVLTYDVRTYDVLTYVVLTYDVRTVLATLIAFLQKHLEGKSMT